MPHVTPLKLEELVSDGIWTLPRYDADVTPCPIDLSDNTNLWGAPPGVLQELREVPASTLARYPSLYSAPLHASALRYLGIESTPELGLLTGCGSDDVIDTVMRAFGRPGDKVAFSSPTFGMIPIFAELNCLTPVAVPLTAQFDIDAMRLVDVGAKITYVCAPNNPTGTAVSRSALEYILSRARGIVLLDEAYAEFAPETFIDLLMNFERLIVARTFSKAFGLAGLRVGLGIGHVRVCDLLERVRGPYRVTSVAERAVLAALAPVTDGLTWVREHAALAVHNRNRFSEELRAMGFDPLPSVANFVLVPASNAQAIARTLIAAGIRVRAFVGLPLEIPCFRESGGAALRIGVGPWPMMQAVLDNITRPAACA